MLDTHASRDRADRVLNQSLATLLVSGGDDRMLVLPRSGLNKYGTAPRIRDAVPFGSCTASSPIELGLEGAREYLDRLRLAARSGSQDAVDTEAEELLEESRKRLLTELELDPELVRVAFCPSGTDAEFLALALVRGGSERPVVNIISGPSEVGGGTTNAAAGRYFNRLVPAGGERLVGAPIDRTLGDSVRIRTIDLRTEEGLMRDPEVMDEVATRQVEETLADNAQVMLHVVAHSKTGAHAPSLECVEALRERFGTRVSVMIDAAQGRMSRRGLREAIAAGYMIMFTGSKFYGGPPFSGALFVPKELWPSTTGVDSLSSGLGDFFTSPELPRDWPALRDTLPGAPNLGLVLRWGAALAQIEAYYQTEASSRLGILRTWEAEVPKLLGVSKHVSLFPVEPIQDPDVKRLLESKTTVFPFFVRRSPESIPLPKSVLTRIFHWLNRDISGFLPDLDEGQKAVLAREVHIGQPVLLTGDADRERSVLRIALGGPLITRIADDARLGPTLESRKAWLRTQVQITRKKLDLIVENLDDLLERDPQ
jgi:selenocysteine lyase/cysteine desulfurase